MENMNMNGMPYEKPISMLYYLNIIFKRKKLILTVFFTIVAAVTIVTFLMPPVYQARSVLIMEKEINSEKLLLLGGEFRDGFERYDWIQTEVNIIQSHPVAVQVVQALKLDQLEPGSTNIWENGKTRSLEKTVESFKNNLKVSKTQGSNVIEITYESGDPQMAVAVVNEVVDTYRQYRMEISDGSETYKFFEEQMRIADDKLRELEKRQTEYKKRKGVISQEAQKEILLTRLADYEKSLTEVRTKRIGQEAKLAVVKENCLDGDNTRIPSTESSDSPIRVQHIAKLEGDLLDKTLQREILLQKFTPQYEEVTDLDRQIAMIDEKIEQEICNIVDMEEASIKALKAEEKALKASIKKIKGEMQEFAQDEYEMSQMSRGIETNLNVYSMFTKQREEARISMAKLERGVKTKILTPAFALPDPVRPKKAKILLMGIFFGLAGALGLAFVVNYFDHSISSPAELEELTELNVLGSIRDIKLEKPSARGKKKSKVS